MPREAKRLRSSTRTRTPKPDFSRHALAPLLVAVAFVLAGCGGATTSREGADLTRGKELFTAKCGGCHTLADAGTRSEIGPDLDNAFGYAREQTFDESTIFEVTLEQMRIPAPPMPDFDEEGSKNRLQEDQLVAVAAYVARCAGTQIAAEAEGTGCAGATAGGGEAAGGTPEEQGKALFTSSGCAGCHVLADAGASGETGPNLDDAKPSLREASEQIANGGGGMPAYKDQLSEKQIEALAKYVSSVAGK